LWSKIHSPTYRSQRRLSLSAIYRVTIV
jgi:hypothetical protein